MMPLKTGAWTLAHDLPTENNELKVFSTFSCAGGSTMGYKLAGYKVLGCLEVDPKAYAVYRTNHNPKYPFLMKIQDFLNLPATDIPAELFDLDILDGSPPCSAFSMSGQRERKWGKESIWAEGNVSQVLDDLFFSFIELANKLQPRVIVAENVTGLIRGNAKGYVQMIIRQMNAAGYDAQIFQCDSSRMGVPQKRERIFFIARRRDLEWPNIHMEFQEPVRTFRDAVHGLPEDLKIRMLSPRARMYWGMTSHGDSVSKIHPRGSYFDHQRLNWDKPVPTLTTRRLSCKMTMHPDIPRGLTIAESIRCQSFPDDFNFLNADPFYLIGMSVPPFMMQRIASSIESQWFNKFKDLPVLTSQKTEPLYAQA